MNRKNNIPQRPTAPPPEQGGRKPGAQKPSPLPQHGVFAILREWMDALVIAFVATMFFRIFFVELFKIPSSSMTPTLIGTQSNQRIAQLDLDHNGKEDLVLLQQDGASPVFGSPLVFTDDGRQFYGKPELAEKLEGVPLKSRNDRLLVNKMAYWFHQPSRGDIVVIKVPPSIWEKDKPIYIKRVVGLQGETLGFTGDGHLMVGGHRVTHPEFFDTQAYQTLVNTNRPEISYTDTGLNGRIEAIHVPPGQLYVFGDNTNGSFDSRYWGGVPIDNVKGRAFFRFWPLTTMKFFHGS